MVKLIVTILAGGLGKRMQSTLPKVLHRVDGSDCSSLLDRIKAEADQFGLCRDRHEVNGNHGAAAVADRAQQRLVEYASELSETNAGLDGRQQQTKKEA